MKKGIWWLVCFPFVIILFFSCANSIIEESGTDQGVAATGVIVGDVVYKDIAISQLLLSEEHPEAILGAPFDHSYGPYCLYDGLEVYFGGRRIESIQFTDLSLFSIGDVTLDKTRAELIAAFGDPIEYYEYSDNDIYRASDGIYRGMLYHISNNALDYELFFSFYNPSVESSLYSPDDEVYICHATRIGQ